MHVSEILGETIVCSQPPICLNVRPATKHAEVARKQRGDCDAYLYSLSAGHGRPGEVKDSAEREQQLQLIKERESKRGLGELPMDHSAQRMEGDY